MTVICSLVVEITLLDCGTCEVYIPMQIQLDNMTNIFVPIITFRQPFCAMTNLSYLVMIPIFFNSFC